MSTRAIRWVVVAIVCCSSGGIGTAQTAIGERPTFRSSADIVTIQASVRNSKGRPIKGLRQADFEVRDNGEVRPILSLRADSRSALTLAVLVDTSGSMAAGHKLRLVRHAFDSVLLQLRPEEDEAAVFSFDSELHEHVGFTSDVTRLSAALDQIEAFGSTSLYDAAAAAARRLAGRTAAHKAIIILTDGTDTSSTLSASDVSGLASSIGVPVYVVATVPDIDQRFILEAAERRSSSSGADLRNLAEWTGGMLLFATDAREMTAAAFTLIDELRHQYVIAIEPAPERQWRRLEIRVRRNAAVVKARSGYFGG
jgi:VWFA-related protein